MKIPRSIRDLYKDIKPKYELLKTEVDGLVRSKKQTRWHYESRVKAEESFTLKLETGREKNPAAPEDFFGCTLVVENHAKIDEAVALIDNLFTIEYRRPKKSDQTHLTPSDFSFDDLRLYVRNSRPGVKPSATDDLLFEFQIKTFLQHAWGIATHDVIYKGDKVEWPASRIAFQIKAMLEHAEVSISQANQLTDATALRRSDKSSTSIQETIDKLNIRWGPSQLPSDVRRLAENVHNLIQILRLEKEAFWKSVDEATAKGRGAKTLNLSPYGAMIASLVEEQGANVFEALTRQGRWPKSIFIPSEIDIGEVSKKTKKHVIQV